MIDLHCHIYPGVDDGPISLEETRAMLDIAVTEGIRTIIASHHFSEEDHTVETYLDAIQVAKSQVQPLIDDLSADIKILDGAEVFISPNIIHIKDLKKLCINNSRYLLIELPMMDIPIYTEDVVYSLKINGITPIIAHPERNRRIVHEPSTLEPLINLGALAQVNTGSITGLFGKHVRKTAKKLIKKNMIHALGSDAHSPRRRGPYMKEAARQLTKWAGSHAARRILHTIPEAIINDGYIEVSDK